MPELRVVVIDDDYWRRTSMSRELDAHADITVVHALDQDEALDWPTDRWRDVDVAIVDVFDENAPGEVGTDVFSGISALERLKHLPVRTVAITPHCQHPLIQLRIFEAGANWLYHRWEVNDLDRLIDSLFEPDDDHVPTAPSRSVLLRYGADGAHPNRSVAVYQASGLHGLLRPGLGLKRLGLPRRFTYGFRKSVADTGFTGTEELTPAERGRRVPRWPDVRDYLLASLGRHNVPATEVDRDDGGPAHG